MSRYYYFAPSHHEQRALIMQILSVIVGVILAAFLWWLTPITSARAVLIGAVLALLWVTWRYAMQMEHKARRAQRASISVTEESLQIIDENGVEETVAWKNISSCKMHEGKISIEWNKGKLRLGARELENGMELVTEIAEKLNPRQSNIIPLMPREIDDN